MKPTTALKHYKTRKAMQDTAVVTRQAVSDWFKKGLIPRRSAELLALHSRGKLTVDAKLYE
jgi:hypothetical protein